MIFRTNLQWPVRILSSVIILTTFPPETVAGDGGNQSIPDRPVCGTAYSGTGQTVTFRDELGLDAKDYHSVRRMGGGRLTPKMGCAFNLCGFSSWSGGEYGDCQLFTHPKSTASGIYTDKFRTSALTCGCKDKRDAECSLGCVKEASRMTWSENGCAVLFQEKECDHCYFRPVYLPDGETIVKNMSYQFHSLIVRENCSVQLDIPAFERKLFEYIPVPLKLPIIYDGGSTWDRLRSAYQEDPETFFCSCGGNAASEDSSIDIIPIVPEIGNPVTGSTGMNAIGNPVTLSTATKAIGDPVSRTGTPPLIPSQESRETGGPVEHYVYVGIGVIIALVFIVGGIVMYRRRRRRRRPRPPEETAKPVELELDEVPASVGNNEEFKTASVRNDEEFKTQLDRFSEVCNPENIVDRSHFTISLDNLKTPLASGNFGIVYKANLQQTRSGDDGVLENVDVAAKTVVIAASASCKEAFFREVRNYQNVGDQSQWHRNVVRFFGACCGRDGLFILTEFCEGGSLERYLKELRPRVLDKEKQECTGDGYLLIVTNNEEPRLTHDQLSMFLWWCEQIASGMNYLSNKKIIHGDLATRNVLLKDRVIKICDFGLSKDFDAQSVPKVIPCNSIAPELLVKGRAPGLPPSVDVWAFGCTVWQIFTLGDPLYGHVEMEDEILRCTKIYSLVSEEQYRHPKPQLAPQSVYLKIMECWSENPLERPSFADLQIYFALMPCGRTESTETCI